MELQSSNTMQNKSLNIFKDCQVEETEGQLLSYSSPTQVFQDKLPHALNICYLGSKPHPLLARLRSGIFYIVSSVHPQLMPEIEGERRYRPEAVQ